MDRSIRKLGLFMMVLFCALFAQLNYIQAFRSEELNHHAGNPRPVDANFAKPRGTVITQDGVIIARSVPVDTKRAYLRDFPEGELYGHITGYLNYNFGATGLEAAYNDELAGTTERQRFRSLTDLWQDRDTSGDLRLTVRSDVQAAAKAASEANPNAERGAIVALDPTSGGILGMWSWPSYDPNLLSSHDDTATQDVKKLLEASEDRPLLPRAYRETYPPGSTFKVVTAATGVELGTVTPTDPVYPVESSWMPPQTQRALRNYGGNFCGGNLDEILRDSCNTSFARMAIEEIGGSELLAGAEAFGFNERPPFDLPTVVSRFPTIDFDEAQPFLAQSAIGQYDVTATPLEMALVSAAIANGGEVPTPHIVDEVTDQDNNVIETVDPGPWRRAVSAATASTIRDSMRQVVQAGTLRIGMEGFDIGGKTGTAQIGDSGRSHAWAMAWAFREGEAEPFIAVAVIVESQTGEGTGTGGQAAGPMVRAVIEAAAAPMPDPPTELPPLPEAATPSTTSTTTNP